MPGEAGGHPDRDHFLAAPPIPLLHQHPSGPHLPLNLPGAATDPIVATTSGRLLLLLLGRGAPLEEPLGVPQLDHGCCKGAARSLRAGSCVCVCVCVMRSNRFVVVPRLALCVCVCVCVRVDI